MRPIDADEVLSKIDKYHRSEPLEPYSLGNYERGINWGLDLAIEAVLEVPTVAGTEMSLPEPKRGQWIEGADGNAFCSECGTEWLSDSVKYYKFCPICGANMEGEQ